MQAASRRTPALPPHRRDWSQFRFLIGLSAWVAQLGLSAAVSGYACDVGRPGAGRAVIFVIGLVTLAVALGTTVTSFTAFREASAGARLGQAEGRERREFLALINSVLGIVVSIAIVWGTLPMAFITNLCEARR